ncbi:UvrD-helicase domain-containing protein [Methylophilaceae bacterium]|nr:UvrD-helicase domain-containing protein [Methylophilaceae bacterium]
MSKSIGQQPIDQKTRQEVVNPKSSFLVQAPAGSGKTTTLARRILQLLTVVEDPKEIIAISFTNKAAAEMHVKVMKQYDAPENREVVKKIKARAKECKWDESFMDLLEIMTIDSLASKITRQAPLLSKSLFMNITQDPHEIYEAVVNETMQDNEQLADLFPFLNYDYQKIKKQLIAELEIRDQWKDDIYFYIDNPTKIEDRTKIYYAKEIKDWVVKLRDFFKKDQIKDIKSIQSYLNPNFSKQENSIDFWLIFRDLVMTKDGKVRKRFGPNEGFIKNKEGIFYKEKLLKILNYPNINNILEDLNNVIYEKNITDILPKKVLNFAILLSELERNLQKQFLLRGELDYTQVVENAIVTLNETDVAYLFDDNVSHILIDEFQDINKLQEKFLKILTDNFSGNPSKSFFAVGDPMQSIYRFRKADVEIFNTLQETEKFGDIRIKARKLEVNFRSNKKILKWLNDIYKHAFGENNDMNKGLISYHSSCESPLTDLIKGDGVKFHILKNKKKHIYTEQQKEADYIFQLIRKIRETKKDPKIVVLARNRSHLRALLTIMRRANFPIEATEIDSIEYNQSFQDILCLTKALYNLNDRVSWIGILRAPWCGLKLEDLTCLFEANESKTPWSIINTPSIVKHLTSDGQKRLAFLKKVISKSIQFRGRVAHRFFIESIWRQLLGQKIIVDTDDIARIDKFFDLVDQSSSPLSIDFERLERLIEDLKTNNKSTDPNPVRFFTIHKAKGDQFECVIIPGLGRIPKADDHSLLAKDKYKDIDILSLNNNRDDELNLYDYHRSKELIRRNNENIRLLYVAITRAEEDCHLIGSVTENSKGEISPPKNSFLNILWPQDITVEYEEVLDDEEFVPKLRRLKSKDFDRELETNTQISKIKDIEKKKISKDNIYTFTGSLIHNYYELIIKKQLDIDYLLSKKLSYIYDIFVKKKFSKPEINSAMQVVEDSLLSLQNSKNGQWIYRLHKNEGMEVNYLHRINDEIKTLIPDRTFIEDGTRWIIDYKTVFGDELDLEMEAKTHSEQLNLYESLFEDECSIQKAIYFVKQGKLVLI